MLDRDIIQHAGFRNLVRDGQAVGFEVALRNPNYRGLASSLVDGVDITVDGHTWSHQENVIVLQGREYSLAELRASSGARWDLDVPAAVRVSHDGGLAVGVHRVEVAVRLRAPYFPIEFQPNVFHATGLRTLVPAATDGPIKLGVSTYSYTGDMHTLMTLEDAMADVADMGATGIEILGEANVPHYPAPTTAWIDAWKANLDAYSLTPTNFGSWVDSRMWLDRDLTVQEGHEALVRDVTLASELGFSFVRPKFGVVSMDLVPHPIWTEAVQRTLDLAAEKNIVICPEIHAPTPIKHPVVDEYIAFIERTGTQHFGLLIDTGIFMQKSAMYGLDGSPAPTSEDDVPVPLRALRVPTADLADILKYVVFFQSKFYEVDEELRDPHIPWGGVLQVLVDAGWSGYLSSEYEGPREPYLAKVMVRRQHAMLRTLLAGLA